MSLRSLGKRSARPPGKKVIPSGKKFKGLGGGRQAVIAKKRRSVRCGTAFGYWNSRLGGWVNRLKLERQRVGYTWFLRRATIQVSPA